MKNTIFTGAAIAIITPMNSDGSINYDELGRLIDDQIAKGTDGIVICGTTSEASTMTDDEHLDCIKFAVKQAAGADALLLVTPYYNKTTQRGLIAHFTAVADAVNIPIILYNIPGRTGMNIEVATVKELAKHRNICAIKEASGNISYAAKLIAECGDDIDVYSGNDDQIVPLMSLGAKGVISVLSHVIPAETHKMAQLCLDNDFASAMKLQIDYLDLINDLFIEDEMSDEHKAKLRASLAKHGLIKD